MWYYIICAGSIMGKKFEALAKKMEQKPVRSDLTLSEVTKYLNHYGFEQVRQKGSHRFFRYKDGCIGITIVEHGGIVNPPYIDDAVQAVKNARDEMENK